MTDAEFIKARVHDAVAKIKPTVVPLAFTKCRWCGKAVHAGMFCSTACRREFYCEDGRHE